MDDPVMWPDGPARRVMTLTAAQALECNRCGQCCDSRIAQRAANRPTHHWWWGDDAPRDGYAEFNGGKPLIIPLYAAHRGGPYEAMPQLAGGAGVAYLAEYTCAVLQRQPDGTATCGLHDQPRPAICGDFPVFGAHGDAYRDMMATRRLPIPLDVPPGCTWANVYVEGL